MLGDDGPRGLQKIVMHVKLDEVRVKLLSGKWKERRRIVGERRDVVLREHGTHEQRIIGGERARQKGKVLFIVMHRFSRLAFRALRKHRINFFCADAPKGNFFFQDF